jgi:hypothetical protein
MAARSDGDRLHLGFLRVVQTDAGYLGGLLVTNRQGRPLEFQCTTPVRPNKTQEILYGPTLQPYIFSELLGKTLHERLAVKPDLIIVEQPELLDLRSHIPTPVACVVSDTTEHEQADQARTQVGRQLLALHAQFSDDQTHLERAARLIPADADLAEPLERVGDALRETVRAGAVA